MILVASPSAFAEPVGLHHVILAGQPVHFHGRSNDRGRVRITQRQKYPLTKWLKRPFLLSLAEP